MILETERLILREFEDSDVDEMVEGLNNLNVTKWMAQVPYPYTKKDAKEYIKLCKNNQSQKERTNFDFAIVLKSENWLIGGLSLRGVDRTQGFSTDGGIWLNEKYHGHGYAAEAWGKRLEFAFETLGLRRLENGFLPRNEKSEKMQKRFGYKIEGVRRQKYFNQATKEIVDEVATALLKEDWIR